MKLTPELILRGYCSGYFPMGDETGEIRWFSPDPRAVFEYERFHVPRSLRKTIDRGGFEIRINTHFRQVMLACADRPDGTWITPPILENYCRLHARGLAHSVEAWRDAKLVGGLYGVAIGGAFFGESMFHRETDASKVALAWLMPASSLWMDCVAYTTEWRGRGRFLPMAW